MTAIKKLMDWIDEKLISLQETLKEERIDYGEEQTQYRIDDIEGVKQKLISLAKEDLKEYFSGSIKELDNLEYLKDLESIVEVSGGVEPLRKKSLGVD